ncbi:NAD-dependent epimerase/dehydratase family protein [Paenibacillus amylolyticus]|uniref:NAD-dependent epimerase/dehydratase family protein n=1 Tax=Paenibacillus amylolyticus TaxID=1451 RepID=UPI000FDBE74B|nr:NAD-dependent epimerase/dehydratase family protein [Paenibacillus amylolyticus]
MSKKILVIGGTRFFGKRLVEHWAAQENVEVTVVSRGNIAFPFDSGVTHIILDRTNEASLRQAAELERWDVVYDHACYSAEAALAAVKVFEGRVERYILTSSLSVYEAGTQGDDGFHEEDFDPSTYPVQMVGDEVVSYQEGKKQAEAMLIQKATFPVVTVRFPIVLGMDDYTRRLHFHIEHVQQGLPIGLPNPKADIGFIQSSEATRFLAWLADAEINGPINAASSGTISLNELIGKIEVAVGKKSIIQSEAENEHSSPFGITSSWYMNTNKAAQAGFAFDSLEEWLPRLVQQISSID